MAWNFSQEIHALTGFDADSTGNTATGETYRTLTAQWLKDSAKEVINMLPKRLLHLCASEVSFTSGTPSVLNTGHILHITRNDGSIEQPCRRIEANQKGRYSDADDINQATATDPVFFVENNKVDVLPVSGACKYSEVQFPTISYDDTAIATFPDEAERAVVLLACIKASEYMLAHDQDVELIIPILAQLKDDYKREIESL
jgi:hypothetical protein